MMERRLMKIKREELERHGRRIKAAAARSKERAAKALKSAFS